MIKHIAVKTIKRIKKIILLSHFSKLEGMLFYLIFFARRIGVDKPNKSAVFYISSIHPPAIRLHQFFYHFIYCGYTCYYDISFSEYMKLRRYGKKATLLKGVYPHNKKNKDYSIVASDNKDYLKNSNPKSLKIFINFHILKHLNSISKNDIFCPLMHFFKYNNPIVETGVLLNALDSKRRIGAFFVGNTKADTYDSNLTKKLFNVNTRYETFNYLTDKLPKNILYIPKNVDSFLKDIESGILEDKVVLLDIKNNFEIPPKYYFQILLQANFFIHMSGVIYPYCHNQIESMMAGCIPITQFSRYFIPPFQQEVDALLFTSLDDLIDIILKMNSGFYNNSIQKMRKNIQDYYREHYSFQSFSKKLSHIVDNQLNYTNYYITTGAKNIIDELLPKEDANVLSV